jgi:hypothetical protein
MLVFASSDKGGTGRSVTSSNLAYRYALKGADVCYLDFDFGSPTAGALFHIEEAQHGVAGDHGLHTYLQGGKGLPYSLNVWTQSESETLRHEPPGAGRLVLFPGNQGGAEFPMSSEPVVKRCAELFLQLDEQFDLVLVDLSAGRSYAVETALAATALPMLDSVTKRWLVFHKWTRQHIIAAADLVTGPRGLLETGKLHNHAPGELRRAIRFVRTAVLDPNSPDLSGLRAAQVAWLQDAHTELSRLASKLGIGRTNVLGIVPHDPVLQWREQLISDDDVSLTSIANQATVDAFTDLALKLGDDDVWRGL